MTAASARILLVAAPASGQGKTTVTAGLARQYAARGLRVRCLKFGPDFLDPTVLARASGAPVHNLDLWMGGTADVHRRLHDAAREADVVLVEAVMGLYDGEPSAATFAREHDLSVLLVVDARAMAQTFGAIVHGLATYGALRVIGVVANGVASEGHARMLAESLPESISLWGTLARDDAFRLPERHLGLVPAGELSTLDTSLDAIGRALAGAPGPPVSCVASPPPRAPLPAPLRGVRVGIARDEAFCFVYPANLATLEELGAELVPFSPRDDARLPEVDALYLPGGYPELHAAALSRHRAMCEAVLEHVQAAKPTLAECGGLMYLARALVDLDGDTHEMVGALDLDVHMQSRRVALGLYRFDDPEDLRGHAFHYSRVEARVPPAGYAKPKRFGAPEPIFRRPGLVASYVHWYFPSNPAAVARLFGAGQAHARAEEASAHPSRCLGAGSR